MFFAQQDNRPLIEFTLAPLFEEHGIALAIMGVLVVFMALVLVSLFITLLPRVMAALSEKRPGQAPSAASICGDDELSPETLFVIAAAVEETIRTPHRIVRIRGMTPEDLGWSLKGRMQHHQSHRIQPRDRR